MSNFFRYLAIALLLLVGVVILAMCGEGLCSICEHVAYPASDRSTTLLGLIRSMSGAFVSALSFALLFFAFASRGLAPAFGSPRTAPVLLRVSTLRI